MLCVYKNQNVTATCCGRLLLCLLQWLPGALSYLLNTSVMIPVVLGVLFVTLCDEDEEGSECVVWRAALRVRPGAGISALPLTIWGGCCLTGMLCLREEGREGTGEGSFFAFTLDDTRLFLSGLEMKSKSYRVWHQVKKYIYLKLQRKLNFIYLDAVLLAGDSLLLLLLFITCRVCLSVVCRVCLSVPCLVSLSVRPWMAL